MQFTFDNKLQKHSGVLMEAAEFYANILLPKSIVKKLWIDFEVDTSIPYDAQVVFDCPYSPDDLGCEEYQEGYLPFNITYKRFAKNSVESHLKTLAHEMVHVKQYALRELTKNLVVSRGGKVSMVSYWKGEKYKAKRKEDEYWDCPWEIEAYGREEGLYRRFRGLY